MNTWNWSALVTLESNRCYKFKGLIRGSENLDGLREEITKLIAKEPLILGRSAIVELEITLTYVAKSR